jgi:pimeloyl-ACP methyl ester carboxylesterase
MTSNVMSEGAQRGSAGGSAPSSAASPAPSPAPSPALAPALASAVRDVAAHGARIRFAEAGKGPPLILVHDYLASRTAWDPCLPLFAQHAHVIAPDLPGFGESEKPSPSRYGYDMQAFCESLVDLVAALGLGRVSLCGHAMGGAIALSLAANYPHVVEKLVLVSPAVYPQAADWLSRVARVPVLGSLLFKQLPGRLLLRMRPTNGAASSGGERQLDRIVDVFDAPAAREAALATIHTMSDTRPLTANVLRVNAPTLVAWGRHDRLAPVEHGRRLAREIRGARFEVFDCGHSPPEECAQAFVGAVASFLVAGRPA